MALARTTSRDILVALAAPTAVFGFLVALLLVDAALLSPSSSDTDDGWGLVVGALALYVLPVATIAAALLLYCLGYIIHRAPQRRTAILVATAALPPLGYLLWHRVYAFNWFDPYSRSIIQDRTAEAAMIWFASVAIVWLWCRLTSSSSDRARGSIG